MRIFDEIFDYVQGLEIIDTHEHLPIQECGRDQDTDILKEYLQQYFNRDLISAGLTLEDFQKVIDVMLPLRERWDLVEPYWEVARLTGYGRALDIAAKELYGVERICGSVIEELNDSFQKTLAPGHFKRVLHENSKIKICLLDRHDQFDLEKENLGCDSTLFLPVYRLDSFVLPTLLDEVDSIKAESGIDICSFDDWLQACEVILNKALNAGAVGLKCGLAYKRTLYFERSTREQAERGFKQVLEAYHLPDWHVRSFSLSKEFQDYMMHFVLGLVNKKGLFFQFHTGLQEGSGNLISNSDPSLLSNLFLEYQNIDFVLFHIGYPYQHVLSALAKNFPNVYIDMCWAHVISPAASIQALGEWLDSVPYNKICAFGGDYKIVDAVYGHQYLARVNVSKVLAAKVTEGLLDMTRAKEIAGRLFFSNPLEIYRLEDKI